MRPEKARLARGNRINWWQEKMTPNSENIALLRRETPDLRSTFVSLTESGSSAGVRG